MLRKVIRKGTHEVGGIAPGCIFDISLKIVREESGKAFQNNFVRYSGGLNFRKKIEEHVCN